jgi:hypothetical protein
MRRRDANHWAWLHRCGHTTKSASKTNNERFGREVYLSFHNVAEGTNSRADSTSGYIQRCSPLIRPIPLYHLNLQFTCSLDAFLLAALGVGDTLGGTCAEHALGTVMDDRGCKSRINLRCAFLGALAACERIKLKGRGGDRRGPGGIARHFRGLGGRGAVFRMSWGRISMWQFMSLLRRTRTMSPLWGLRLVGS